MEVGLEAGALVGVLSDRDVLARSTMTKSGHLEVPTDVVVGEAMTHTPLATCEVDTDIRELVQVMTERKIDAIPVVRGLKLVGLVTSTDLLLLLLDKDEPLGTLRGQAQETRTSVRESVRLSPADLPAQPVASAANPVGSPGGALPRHTMCRSGRSRKRLAP